MHLIELGKYYQGLLSILGKSLAPEFLVKMLPNGKLAEILSRRKSREGRTQGMR